MAKGIGLIGNFSGKVGNTVGYQLSASNNGQTQGVRVYQPNVKNPKTAAQAEQRAKLSPVNATYRSLKNIIDRGNEGLPYGNKSRLAWLKKAMRAQNMPWYEKDAIANKPVICQVTKGSLQSLSYGPTGEYIKIDSAGVTSETAVNTLGGVSKALMDGNSFLKEGDQITFCATIIDQDNIVYKIFSFVLKQSDVTPTTAFQADSDAVSFVCEDAVETCLVIVSREGSDGEHLRSSESIHYKDGFINSAPYDTTSKTAAIKSYMTQAGAEGDWAEESLKD